MHGEGGTNVTCKSASGGQELVISERANGNDVGGCDIVGGMVEEGKTVGYMVGASAVGAAGYDETVASTSGCWPW